KCRHSVPKFDICALERVLDFSLPFLRCFFCFFAGSRARDDCKRTAIISHIRMVSSLCDMDSERCLYPSSQGYLESDFFFHVHCTKRVWCVTPVHIIFVNLLWLSEAPSRVALSI